VAATATTSHRRPRQVPCHEASMNVQASFISMLLPHVTMCPTKCGNSKRFKSHHQSTQNHHGQQCREPHHGQPQNGNENATYLLRTTPPPSLVASAAVVGGLHRRRHSRGGHCQCKPPQPSPTMAAAASIVSIACAFQTLDGFLVSGGAAHTPCGCACTLYSPNYQNTPGFRLSCS